MKAIKQHIQRYPYHLLLLPLFFVLHGFLENYPFVAGGNTMLLFLAYSGVAIILFGVFYLLLKCIRKAAVMTSAVMAANFFFGTIHDTLKDFFGAGFITKYGVLILIFLIALACIYIFTRKRKGFYRTTSYLTILLLVLVIIDLGMLATKLTNGSGRSYAAQDPAFQKCDSCTKPDVYIIVLDEYAGRLQLKELYDFDNGKFLDALNSRGFKTIPFSLSNYNYTPYSTASLLNMGYLDKSQTTNVQKGFKYSINRIDHNRVVNFFISNGYTFYNYSPFTVAGSSAPIKGSFVPKGTELITAGTFVSRFEKDVLLNLATKFNWSWYIKKKMYSTLDDNNQLYNLTAGISRSGKSPKIVYTHLLMPHFPFYHDSTGRLRSFDELKGISMNNTDAYLGYLKHVNEEILKLVDGILSNAKQPPVIAIMSDHGYRHFPEIDTKYYFYNFLSVHLPSCDYRLFADTMSNVNFMKSVLNTDFSQRLEIEKDSTWLIDF